MTVPSASSIPLVALVGRPNVGKSTLFNRLVGKRTSLVNDQPGVTRDRLFGEAHLDGKIVRVVDTGGLDDDPNDPLITRMRAQTELAVAECDLVLFVVDGREGLMPADQEVANLLRKSGQPLAVVVNKIDGVNQAGEEADFYRLGLDNVLTVSAEHGVGIENIVDFLLEHLDPPTQESFDELNSAQPVRDEPVPEGETSRVEWDGEAIAVAVIGRPNVGKSSLINCLLGEDRLLATEIAGTTRDSVDIKIERDGQKFVLVDTAGMRRRKSVVDLLEKYSVMASMRSIDRCDVVLMVLDATQRISAQDMRVASMAHQKGKGIVIVANKWDLIENPEWRDNYPESVYHDLGFLKYAPLVRVSALTGRGTHKLLAPVIAAQKERHRRISTGTLNRFFEEVLARHPPGMLKGKRGHIYYGSQPMVRPPTFVFTCRNPHHISDGYARYLRNQLRENFGFEATPLWLKFRPRGHHKEETGGKRLDR